MTVNANGLVIGSNAIVIRQIDGRLRITGIVVPRPDPAVAAQAPRQEARRVGIRIGPRPTQESGALAAGASDAYVVWIPKGKMLDARLERIQNRAAVVRVKQAVTGAPLNRNCWRRPRRYRPRNGKRRLQHRGGTDRIGGTIAAALRSIPQVPISS